MAANSTKRPSAGRPPSIVADDKTLRELEALAKIQCTQAEAAAVLGVTRQTLNEFLGREPDARERWNKGLDSGKASLRRNQFRMSETNATMAIWLGKQYLGQKDETHQHVVAEVQVTDARDKLAHLVSGAATVAAEGDDPPTTH